MNNGFGSNKVPTDVSDRDTEVLPAADPAFPNAFPAEAVAPFDPATGEVVGRPNPYDPTLPMSAISPISGGYAVTKPPQNLPVQPLELPERPRIVHPLEDYNRSR